MQDGTGLQYFLSDHLGSIVAVTDSTGTLTSQLRYLPFGQVRANIPSPNLPSIDYGYTGQRNLDESIGLMDYKARFYSPYLNRFIQPDTIIPDPSNPQAYNRYSYVYGNPLKYTDPSGHDPKCGPDGIWCGYDGSGYAGGTGSKGGGGGDSNPSTGGGGNTEVDIPSCGYHHCEVETNLYEMGWENFGQAWDIYSNPNATYGQRFVAGSYMSFWGGGHALFVAGSALLIYAYASQVAIFGASAASADGDPTNELRIFYRGDDAGLTSMVSKAGQISMQHARQLLANGNLKQLMINHAKNSSSPPSPFISVTTDPRVAKFWADLGGGQVYKIVTSRAIYNPYGIPGESEWLVPLIIKASEIIK